MELIDQTSMAEKEWRIGIAFYTENIKPSSCTKEKLNELEKRILKKFKGSKLTLSSDKLTFDGNLEIINLEDETTKEKVKIGFYCPNCKEYHLGVSPISSRPEPAKETITYACPKTNVLIGTKIYKWA